MPKISGRKSKRKPAELTVDEAMRFLDDVQRLHAQVDEPTRPISLRVPENVLRSFKARARLDGKKYQTVVVALMREWILKR